MPSASTSVTASGRISFGFDAIIRRIEPCLSFAMLCVIGVLTRSEDGFSTETSASGFFSSCLIFSMLSALGRANSLLR